MGIYINTEYWPEYSFNAITTDNNNNDDDDNTAAGTFVTTTATANNSNNNNNNIIIIQIIITIKMKSGCALKKVIKSSYIYCLPHFLFGEKMLLNSVLVSVKCSLCH